MTEKKWTTYLRFILVVAAFIFLGLIFSGIFNTDKSYGDNAEQNQSGEIKLVESGKLSVAVSPPYPPFIELQGNNLVGFEPDVYKEIAKLLNLEIEEKIMNFDAILPAVASGTKCDIAMSGISVNAERKETVDFSDSYYNSDISFIVKQGSDINSANAGIKLYNTNLRFAVQSGTTSESYVHENFPNATCIAYNAESDCFSAINANQADVMCGTKAVCSNLIKTTYRNMIDVADIATNEEYAIAVSKDNPQLTSKINWALNQLKENGVLQKYYALYGISSNEITKTKKLSTVKCTAKPNSLSANAVMGDLETRVVWEGQASTDELISEFSFNIPDKMNFNSNDVSVSMLTGDDLLNRSKPDSDISYNDNVLTVQFSDLSQIKPGAYFSIEFPSVVFDKAGGDINIEGSYKLSDGTISNIDDIPPIAVEEMNIFQKFAYDINDSAFVKAWNSNTFLNLFFNPSIFLISIPIVFNGFLMALATVLCAFPLALPLGLLLALLRLSGIKFLRAIGTIYVNIVRGTPLFLQIYIAFFGLPLAGINIPNFPLGLIVLAMNSSAYVCEIFRAAIQAVPVGQTEAARSLGLNKSTTMLFIVIPQAIKQCIPTLTSEFILLYKDTSLLASVGVMEVVMFAKTIVAATGSITPYIVAALFYLALTIPLAKGITVLEKKLSGTKSNRSKGKKNKQSNKIDSNKLGSM